MNKKPQACKGCPMEKIGQGFVEPQVGTLNELVIIGEAPGESEVSQGKPFVGASGRLLNSALQRAEIRRDEVYITNVMKCRPPDNKIPDFFDPAECANRYLNKELEQLKTKKMIVTLGATSTKYLFKPAKITRHRGSILNSTFGKFIPALHPAFIMRGMQKHFITLVLDLIKAKEYIANPDKFLYEENFIINPTVPQVVNFTEKVLAEKPEILSFDIENTYSGVLITQAVGARFKEGIIVCSIPILKQGGKPYWNLIDEEVIWLHVHKLLKNDIPKLAHFGYHDLDNYDFNLLPVENYTDDTHVLHVTMWGELSHKLEFLGSVHTPMPFWKEDKREDSDEKVADIDLPTDSLQLYNCRDVLGTLLAYEDITISMKEEGMEEFYRKKQMPIFHIMRKVSKRGIKLDVDAMALGYKKLDEEANKITSMLSEAAGYPINLASPKQIGIFLFDDLGFQAVDKTATGQPSTAESSIRKLLLTANEDQEKILRLILDFRSISITKNTFCTVRPGRDGKVHSRFKLGPSTNRWASSDINFQNLPRKAVRGVDVRSFYIADDGYIIVAADYSQLELRLLAYHSLCQRLINVFLEGRDPHSENARILYKLPKDAVIDKESEMRAFAKIFVYLVSYLGGVKVLVDNALNYDIVLKPEQAKEYIDNYYSGYPEISTYQQREIEEAIENRVLYNSFGHRRNFFGTNDEIRGQAGNYRMQSDNAGIINDDVIELDKLNHPIILQWHDAIYELVKEGEVEKYATEMKQVMERPFKLSNGQEVIFPVDFKVGKNLSKMEKLKL